MLTRAWSIFLFCFYAGGAFRLPMLVCLLLYLQNGEADNDSTCHWWPSTVGGTRWWSGSEGCWFLQAASKTIVQKLVKRAARSIEDVNRDWTIPFPVSLIIFLIRNIFCTVVPHLERVIFLRILIRVLCSRKKGKHASLGCLTTLHQTYWILVYILDSIFVYKFLWPAKAYAHYVLIIICLHLDIDLWMIPRKLYL